MESITIYPRNEKQKSLLTALLEELQVHFEVGNTTVPTLLTAAEFYAKIDTSLRQAEAGKVKQLSQSEQKDWLEA